jgi:aminocarboxymuconate-semialdehyde decarboxylase
VSIIDFHNHFYPPEYLEALRVGPSNVRVSVDSEGNPVLHYPGDYNTAVRGHRDIEYREQVLEQRGIDKQILTLTTPGTHVETPQRAVALARLVNDAFAAITQKRPKRFAALATLPLNDPESSVIELERAYKQLGLKGAMLFSNVNGVGLSDKRFWPLYEKAEELAAILFIHPTNPASVEGMKDFWLTPLVGFMFDTTLAAAGLVFSGVVEKFPRLTWVLAHLGGAIPYIAERLDRGFHAFRECRANIRKPPSEYLKHFYYDTVNFDSGPLQAAIQFAGVSHLLAGSDYPHQIGSLRSMLNSIRGLAISEEDRAAIFGQNAARLLRL